MDAHDTIQPLADGSFSLEVYNEAFRKASQDPATLTDLELRTLACYDADGAEDAARRRAAILDTRAVEAQQQREVRIRQHGEERRQQDRRTQREEKRRQRDERRWRAAEPREPDVQFLPTVTYDREMFERALKLAHDDPHALADADIAQLAVVDVSLVGSVARLRAHRKSADEEDEEDEDLSRPLTLTVGGLRNLVGGIAKSISEHYDPIMRRTFDRITRAMVRITELEQRAGGTADPNIIQMLEQRCARVEVDNTRLALQLKALQDRPTLEYMGVWQSQQYPRGAAVTFHGSLWIAERDTAAQPSLGAPEATGWRLAVKRGADGKDRV